MAKILIIAEHNGEALNPSTAKCVTCATTVAGAEIDVVVLGASVQDVASQAAEISGVNRVLTIERQENDPAIAAILAPQIVALAPAYSHVFGPSTTFGKDLMPRVAALLGVNQISDIMSVHGTHGFTRPVYAGNAILTVEAPADSIVVATVRAASYAAAEGGNSAAIESTKATRNCRRIRASSVCKRASRIAPTCSRPQEWCPAGERSAVPRTSS